MNEPKQPKAPERAAEDSHEQELAIEGVAEIFSELFELLPAPDKIEASSNEVVRAQPAATIPDRIAGMVIGKLTALSPQPLVSWAGAPGGAVAGSLVPLNPAAIGSHVALMFDQQQVDRPVITGIFERFEAPCETRRRVVIEGPDELVLRAGKASLTLTRAGKIILRGAYISSTATGTHRIRGGVVSIN